MMSNSGGHRSASTHVYARKAQAQTDSPHVHTSTVTDSSPCVPNTPNLTAGSKGVSPFGALLLQKCSSLRAAGCHASSWASVAAVSPYTSVMSA